MKRKFDEFYAEGRGQGVMVLVEAVRYENGNVTATADTARVTEAQLESALRERYPGYAWKLTPCGTAEGGYWIADGRETT